MPPKTKITEVKKPTEKAVWTFKGKEDFEIPSDAYGFTYRIDVIGTPIYYYGQKKLTTTSGKGKKAITKESAWRAYEGSSVELKELIKSGKKIKKRIIDFAYTKSELTLKEAMLIICNGCLTDENSLNRWIYCRVYQRNLVKKE